MITIAGQGLTYVLSRLEVPKPQNLPWFTEPCDAFVAVLQCELMTDQLGAKICSALVDLPTEWVETMGREAECVHDLVDSASVKVGRQANVGNGNPMTAWHLEMRDIPAMAEYLRLGGLGSTSNKLVVVIGSEGTVDALAREVRRLCELNLE